MHDAREDGDGAEQSQDTEQPEGAELVGWEYREQLDDVGADERALIR